MTFQTIAGQLGKTGLCVCPNFLTNRVLQNTATDLELIHASGKFHRAGIGRDRAETGVRSDETFWLNRDLKNGAQGSLWRRIDALKRRFNRSLFLGLTDFEGHYAVYPEGGYYERHTDQFCGTSERIISFVLYLNRDWKAPDGGRLRVYGVNANNVESYTEIDPVGGTMVCFLSESPHEVMLSHRQRCSFTGWFKGPVKK